MNKRQQKKDEQKLHLAGGSYQLDKEYSRICHENYNAWRRRVANGILYTDDEFAELIELGIYTEDEVKELKFRKGKRWIR